MRRHEREKRRPRLNQNGQMPNVHNIGDELSDA